jgi:hypothetical protein
MERGLHLKHLQSFTKKEWRVYAADKQKVDVEFGVIMGRLINARAKE